MKLDCESTNQAPKIRLFSLACINLLILLLQPAEAQLTGTKTINPSGSGANNYTTFSAAISALNTSGVGSGGVTFNVSAAATFIETLPALTASGTSSNPIVFQKSGVGANPKVVPATRGMRQPSQFNNGDAIIQINGGDYITFDGIDAVDDTITFSNHGRYEYGYMLRKASPTDACKYVVIRNATVVLAKSNIATVGIYVSNQRPRETATTSSDTLAAGITVTSVGGRSENIRIDGNTIVNALCGIAVRGYAHGSSPYHLMDHFLRIGSIAGNTMTGFGYGSTNAAYGIYTMYQDSSIIAQNTVDGGNGCTAALTGIFTNTATNASVEIAGNTITLSPSGSTALCAGIVNASGASGTTNYAYLHDNTIHNTVYATATSGAFRGIEQSAAAKRVIVSGNTVQGNRLAGTGTFHGIYISANLQVTDSLFISQNAVAGNRKTGTSGGFYGVQAGRAVVLFTDNSIHDDTVDAGTTIMAGYMNNSNPETENNTGNSIYNLRHGGTASLYGILCTTADGEKNSSGNSIRGLRSGGAVYGISSAYGSPHFVSANSIYDLESTGTSGTAYGIMLGAPTGYISNNMISDLRAPSSGGNNAVIGVNVSGASGSYSYGVYNNTVYLNASSSSITTFGSSAVFVNELSNVEMRNNIFVNTSTPGPTGGYTVSYRRSGSTISTYGGASDNNLFFAGTPSARRLIFHDGTLGDSTVNAYKSRVSPYDAFAVSENPPFLNVTTPPYNLHLSASIPTLCESTGSRVTSPISIATDIDGDIRHGESGYTGSGFAPDLGADEGEYSNLDLVPPTITYVSLGSGCVSGSRPVAGIDIVDAAGVKTTSGLRPRLYFKKGGSANQNLFNTNSSATPGWKWVEATGASSPFTFVVNYALLPGGGVALGDTIQYFFVAQDNSSTGNVGINSGLFATQPSSVALGSSSFPIGGSVRHYMIVDSISGLYTVGPGGDFTTLTAAAASFNTRVQTGPVIFSLISSSYGASETFPIVFRENPGGSSTRTLTIQPATGITATISGNATSLIKFLGVDYATIDGSNAGTSTRNLTIANTASGAAAAIWIASAGVGAGAHRCTVRNCELSAGNNTNAQSFGLFAGDSLTLGIGGADNDSLTVGNNVVTLSAVGIGVVGTSTGTNSAVTITGNSIGSGTPSQRIGKAGISLQHCTGASVTLNEIFDLIVPTMNPTGIFLGSGVVSTSILRNKIHGVRYTDPLGYGGKGIDINTGAASSALTIANNLVYDIGGDGWEALATDAIVGIRILGSTGGVNISYNTVHIFGTVAGNTGGTISAALYVAATASAIQLRNNILVNARVNTNASGAAAYSIFSDAPPSAFTAINSNCYFGAGAQSRLGNINTTDMHTIADWRSATGQDATSTDSDPWFNSDTDLRPNLGSPVLGAGIPIAGITTDYAGVTRHASAPTIGAYETGQDAAGPTISYTPLGSSSSTTTRIVNGIAIIDYTGVNTNSGTAPRLYYKKGFDYNEWNDNTNTTEGWKWVQTSGTSSPFSFNIDYSKIPGGVAIGDTIYYFVTAQDVNTTPYVSVKSGVCAVSPTGVALGASAFPIGGTINTFQIRGTISGTIYIPGTYPSLTGSGGLFADINSRVVNGAITVLITDSLDEDGSYGLDQWSEEPAGSNYTLTIRPSAASVRTIFGHVSSQPMIRLNGADRVVIDGRYNGSGRYVRLVNASIDQPTIALLNDAKNDTIRSCVIEGAVAWPTTGVLFFGAGITSGNDCNFVTRNLFKGRDWTGQYPAHLVYSEGLSSTVSNSDNAVTENLFENYLYSGVTVSSIGNGARWDISGNNFYQTLASPPSTPLTAIAVLSGTSGHTIHNNSIGGSDSARNGAAMRSTSSVSGIILEVGAATTSARTSVQANTISNIASMGDVATAMISVSSGKANIGTVTGNIIGGGATARDTIAFGYDGDLVEVWSNDSVNVENNIIGDARYRDVEGDRLVGIGLYGRGVYSVRENIVTDLASSTEGGGVIGFGIYGIRCIDQALFRIEKNTVSSVRNTRIGGAPYAAYGIAVGNAAAGSTIHANRICDILADNSAVGAAAPAVYGIAVDGGSMQVANNFISVGSGAGNDQRCYGMYDAGSGAVSYIYNSVFVGGSTASSVSNNTYTFFTEGDGTIRLRNNAFINARSNGAGATGAHAALGVGSAFFWVGGSPVSTVTSNYNFFSTRDSLKAFEWEAAQQDLQSWKANLASLDAFSWYVRTGSVTNGATLLPSDLFTNSATADLSIQTAHAASRFVSGKAIAGAESENIDGDQGSQTVRITTAGIGTDIGADEFTTSSTPFPAMETGQRSPGDSTTYTLNGKIIARIFWTSGTPPSSVALRWYPGEDPLLVSAGNYSNAYWLASVTGGSGYRFRLRLYYMPAILGSISAPDRIRLGSYYSSVWNHSTFSQPNESEFWVQQDSLSTLSLFALSDNNAPLPVELASFTAKRSGGEVLLAWTTTSELNALRYAVERRSDSQPWSEIGSVDAAGSSDREHGYSFIDQTADRSRTVYYRLRMIDRDGTFEYSPEAVLPGIRPHDLVLYANHPNPFSEKTIISLQLPVRTNVLIQVSDMAGRVVDRVFEGTLDDGVHAFAYVPTGLPLGTYICTVQTADRKIGRPILFMR